MKIKILEESGYEYAVKGMAYSYKDRAEDVDIWWNSKKDRASERANKITQMDGGHNKLLESIQLWIDIEATRAFWSEFDTYRVGITKQSESTMHTLSKRMPIYEDFEDDTPQEMITAFVQVWNTHKNNVNILKNSLPEGFLQRRIVCLNYKCLRNIIHQRKGHRYRWWDIFIKEVMSQLQHPEFIFGDRQ